MISIKEYVERMFKNVPVNENTKSIKQEIMQNLEEKVRDLIESGKAEEDAVNKAIVDFGDFEEIKKELMDELTVGNIRGKVINMRKYSNRLWYSICGSSLIIGLVLFINFYYSPQTIWFVYPTFAILWWPLSAFFVWMSKKSKRQGR